MVTCAMPIHMGFQDPARFTKGIGFLQKHGAEAARPLDRIFMCRPVGLRIPLPVCFRPWNSRVFELHDLHRSKPFRALVLAKRPWRTTSKPT